MIDICRCCSWRERERECVFCIHSNRHHVLKDVEGMISLIDDMSWSNCKFVCRFSSRWVEKQCKSVNNFPFLFLPTLFLTLSLSLSLSMFH